MRLSSQFLELSAAQAETHGLHKTHSRELSSGKRDDANDQISLSLRDQRTAAAAGAPLDVAHLVDPGREGPDAVWGIEEKCRRHFVSRADGTVADAGGCGIRVSQLRADDPSGGDVWNHRAHEGYREGFSAVGGLGAEVGRRRR